MPRIRALHSLAGIGELTLEFVNARLARETWRQVMAPEWSAFTHVAGAQVTLRGPKGELLSSDPPGSASALQRLVHEALDGAAGQPAVQVVIPERTAFKIGTRLPASASVERVRDRDGRTRWQARVPDSDDLQDFWYGMTCVLLTRLKNGEDLITRKRGHPAIARVRPLAKCLACQAFFFRRTKRMETCSRKCSVARVDRKRSPTRRVRRLSAEAATNRRNQ